MLVSSQGHNAITAFIDGSATAASWAPPPPIDQPPTAILVMSSWPKSGDPARVFSSFKVTNASSNASFLASGCSKILLVPIVIVTIPCEAKKGPQF